jgi:hypothetical protein
MPSFQETYDFPSKVRLQYGPYVRYRALKTGEKYKTGREKWDIYFMKDASDEPCAIHTGMELMSKKAGKPYFVCKRERKELETFDNDKSEDEEEEVPTKPDPYKTHDFKTGHAERAVAEQVEEDERW